MIAFRLLPLATLALVAITTADRAAAESHPIPVPGTHVVLDLPDGFAPDPRGGPSLIDDHRHVAVMALEFPPESYADRAKSFSPDTLLARGIRAPRIGRLQRAGEHVFATGPSTAPGAPAWRYVLLDRSPAQATLILLSVGPGGTGWPPAEVETALASLRIEAEIKPLDLPFRLAEPGPFRFAGLIERSTAFTEDGHLPATDLPRASELVVSPIGRLPSAGPGLEAGARALLTEIAGIRAATATGPLPREAGPLTGLEFVVPPSTGSPDQAFGLYLLVLKSDGDRVVTITGRAPAADWERHLGDLRKAALSVRLTAP